MMASFSTVSFQALWRNKVTPPAPAWVDLAKIWMPNSAIMNIVTAQLAWHGL